jgi:hypothetical protein
MNRVTTAPTGIKIAVLLACLACAAPISAASAAGITAGIHFTPESIAAYEHQLASGQIRAATFNTKVRSVHLTLADGKHVLFHYAPHGEAGVLSALKAKGIAPMTEKGKPVRLPKAHHHKLRLRYIVAGVVVLVIILVGIILFSRRRRREE